jgi:hypothetical protein
VERARVRAIENKAPAKIRDEHMKQNDSGYERGKHWLPEHAAHSSWLALGTTPR